MPTRFIRKTIANQLVHIVDKDTGFLQALSIFLRLEGLRVATYTNLADLYHTSRKRRPDLFIINFEQNDGRGLQALRRMRLEHPSVPVLMVGDQASDFHSGLANGAGATDVLTKPVDTSALMAIIVEALSYPSSDDDGRPAIRGNLTPRENEVLDLLAVGQTNKEVGRQLGISPRTVEVHRMHIMTKLGAKNVADLIRITIRHSVAN